MRPLIQILARLYPQQWRTRYGAEFDALLEDSNPSARVALNVLTGAFVTQLRANRKTLSVVLLAAMAVAAAAWYAGQHPYISPGSNLVLRQDSDLGALVTLFAMLVTFMTCLVSLGQLVCGRFRSAGKTFLAAIAGFGAYSCVVILISVLSPRTIVSASDGYCYDLWCIAVNHVEAAAPQGENVVYKAEVRLFSDAHSVKTGNRGAPVYVVDDRGRRFPLTTASPLEVTLSPGDMVNAEVTFVAASDAHQLFLTRDSGFSLYLGSDLCPFHRRTLLRIL